MAPPWVETLEVAGWPTTVVVLDFETYYDADYQIKKSSTIEFIMDARFEVLGHSRVVTDGGQYPFAPNKASFWHDSQKDLRWLQSQFGANLERCTVVAHNAIFDMTILVRKFGIMPPYIVDTLGLARAWDPRERNDLAHLCERYGLTAKGDTKQFIGVRWADMDQAMQTALAEYANNDAEQEFNLLRIMLPLLSRPGFELSVMRHTLGLFLDPCIGVDFEAGKALVKAMETEVRRVVLATGKARKTISGTISFERELREALGDEEPPMKQGKLKPLLAIAKPDEGRAYLLAHKDPVVRGLMQARVGMKSWPLHMKRVQRIAAQAHAAGGLLPVPLNYAGAHTGRWSGGGGINLQNLGKRSEEPLVRKVRTLLVAPPGKILVIADAAQIEARVLAWIAGQLDLLKAFADGVPIYCKFASELLGKRIRKARPDDPAPIKAYLKDKRQLGKIGVLGCGYGMGWKHCMIMAKQQYQIILTPAMAKKLVDHYRQTNQQITKFWRDVEHAFKYVIKYPTEQRSLPRGLRIFNHEDCVYITLPCGRNLRYPKARVGFDDQGREQIWWPDPSKAGTRTHAWGGLLTENIVQAASRDVLAEALLRCEERGIQIGLHVHDELIGVVDEEYGNKALDIQLEALRIRPTWAANLPLDAEGYTSTRYGE